MSARTLKLPIFCAVVSSVSSSVAWIFEQEAVLALGPFTMVALCNLLGAAFLGVFLIFRSQLPTTQQIRLVWKDVLILVLARPVAAGILYALSLTMTSSVKLIFFTKAEPYLVLFWSYLFYDAIVRRNQLALLFVHLIGAVALSTGGDFRVGLSQIGDLLILLALMVLAVTYPVGARLSKVLGSLQTNFISLLIGGILLIPLQFCFNESVHSIADLKRGIVALVWLVILFQVIALNLWYYALLHLQGWVVSSLRSLGPLVAAPIAILFFGQSLNAIQIVGGFIVIATSFLIIREEGALIRPN